MDQENSPHIKQRSTVHWAAGRIGIARWEEELAEIEQGLRLGTASRKGATERLSTWLDFTRKLPENEEVFLAQLDPQIRGEVLQISERIVEAIFQCADEYGLKISPEDDAQKPTRRKPSPRGR